MSLAKPQYVSDLVVYLLHELEIEYAILNPGATTRGLHESLVTYGGNTAPEVITCCHEEVAVGQWLHIVDLVFRVDRGAR